jgi:CheY-like chemotaxis protein
VADTVAKPAPAPHAIVVSASSVTGTLRVLIERLVGVGIPCETCADVSDTVEKVGQNPKNPPCIILDQRDLLTAAPDAPELAAAAVTQLRAALPHVTPVILTLEAPTTVLVACLRAGAADLIDLKVEGTAEARRVVTRVWAQQRARLEEETQALTLRGMVEDLLKDLIKTERRSLDLEDKVSAYRRQTREMQPLSETRQPAVVLVDPDERTLEVLKRRLEEVGVDAYTFARGEDALHHVESSLPSPSMFDVAMVTAQLPGIDGLETITRLREQLAGMPAFLVTQIDDGELAAQAADLGVVGFVRKPFTDLDDVIARLAQLATGALGRTREHSYLERIKTRHERVLARYRALPRGA